MKHIEEVAKEDAIVQEDIAENKTDQISVLIGYILIRKTFNKQIKTKPEKYPVIIIRTVYISGN